MLLFSLQILWDIEPKNNQKKNDPTVVINKISDKNIPDAAIHKTEAIIELKNASEIKNLFFI